MANKSLEGEKGLNRGKWNQTKKTYNNQQRHLLAATMIAWPIKDPKMRRTSIEASSIIIETQTTKSRNLPAAVMIAWPVKFWKMTRP
jgi:hypothetical protein